MENAQKNHVKNGLFAKIHQCSDAGMVHAFQIKVTAQYYHQDALLIFRIDVTTVLCAWKILQCVLFKYHNTLQMHV